jgi:electron-transferring-flavoprotein dehydrogenase
LNELLPDWKENGAPLNAPVTEDRFIFLSEPALPSSPRRMLPGCFKNHGNYVVSLGNVCRWLASRPKRWAWRSSRDSRRRGAVRRRRRVKGVATGDMGVDRKAASQTDAYQPGMELHAQVHVLRRRLPRPPRASSCRNASSCARASIRRSTASAEGAVGDRRRSSTSPGLVMHTAGWPLERDTYGGSFLYHMETTSSRRLRRRAGYTNPYLQPVRGIPALQDASRDPRPSFEGGKRIAYGARAIARAACSRCRKLVFPGGA